MARSVPPGHAWLDASLIGCTAFGTVIAALGAVRSGMGPASLGKDLLSTPVMHALSTTGLPLTLAAGSAWLARYLRRLHRRLDAAERRSATIFERAGISMWDEDWSVVGKAIHDLKAAGITDMQAHFTAFPEQARALRGQVIIKDVNAFTVEMMHATGKEVLVGPLDRILPHTDQTFIHWLVAFGRGESLYRSEAHLLRPDGTTLDCVFAAALPTSLPEFETILVCCIDVTSFKAAQASLVAVETELAHASRISTMGALTASIAHEVNSPLAAIVSNAEAALRWLDRTKPAVDEALIAARNVITDARRAREVVTHTRMLLSNSPKRTAAIDMVETARQAILLIEREFRALNTSVHFAVDDDIPPVYADKTQLQQVLVNLLLNGAQAMTEVAGPRDLTLTIRDGQTHILVSVIDRGGGIVEPDLGSVFTPFYTSKPDGMGMGLAICRTCIEAHGGRIWFETQTGIGTHFHFTLPLMARA